MTSDPDGDVSAPQWQLQGWMRGGMLGAIALACLVVGQHMAAGSEIDGAYPFVFAGLFVLGLVVGPWYARWSPQPKYKRGAGVGGALLLLALHASYPERFSTANVLGLGLLVMGFAAGLEWTGGGKVGVTQSGSNASDS